MHRGKRGTMRNGWALLVSVAIGCQATRGAPGPVGTAWAARFGSGPVGPPLADPLPPWSAHVVLAGGVAGFHLDATLDSQGNVEGIGGRAGTPVGAMLGDAERSKAANLVRSLSRANALIRR